MHVIKGMHSLHILLACNSSSISEQMFTLPSSCSYIEMHPLLHYRYNGPAKQTR